MTSKRQIGNRELSACKTLEETTPNKKELRGSKHSRRRWGGLQGYPHQHSSSPAGRQWLCVVTAKNCCTPTKIQLKRPQYWGRPVDFRAIEFVPLVLSNRSNRRKKHKGTGKIRITLHPKQSDLEHETQTSVSRLLHSEKQKRCYAAFLST